MKRIAFVIGLLTLTGSVVRAQQEYFMFIQADNQQPFYVRLGEKTYSSSGVGHLVIPRMKDSSYNLQIGFPRKLYPEQVYAVAPNGKDLDFRLRHSENDGWNLVNGQTAQTVPPRKDEVVKTSVPLGEKKTGGFAVLMSGLVNDSAVMYKTVAKVIVPPAPPVVAAATPEQTIAAPATVTPVSATITDGGNATAAVTTPLVTSNSKTDSVITASPDSTATAAATPRSVILDVQEWWNEKGKGYIYYDSTLLGVDTISILVEYGPPKMINPNQAVDGPAKIDSVKDLVGVDTVLGQQAAAADAARKKTDSLVAATEKTVTPVVPVLTNLDSTAKTTAVPAEDKTTTANTNRGDSTRLTTVTTPAPTTAIDSAKQAQATAAGNAKVDSVKAISAPVTQATKTAAAPAAIAKTDSSKSSGTTTSTDLPKKDSTKASSATVPAGLPNTDSVKVAVVTAEPKKETDKASTAITELPKKDSVKTAEPATAKSDSVKAAAETKKQLLMMNSDCVNFATESDVDKLRVKLLNTNGTEDRIAAAKKVFKTKCFVTRYIRGLSELFPNDEARFQFFDAAYPYVSDSGKFRTLIDLFTEELWIARFKALVRM